VVEIVVLAEPVDQAGVVHELLEVAAAVAALREAPEQVVARIPGGARDGEVGAPADQHEPVVGIHKVQRRLDEVRQHVVMYEDSGGRLEWVTEHTGDHQRPVDVGGDADGLHLAGGIGRTGLEPVAAEEEDKGEKALANI
jgi:hypothetical protein